MLTYWSDPATWQGLSKPARPPNLLVAGRDGAQPSNLATFASISPFLRELLLSAGCGSCDQVSLVLPDYTVEDIRGALHILHTGQHSVQGVAQMGRLCGLLRKEFKKWLIIQNNCHVKTHKGLGPD